MVGLGDRHAADRVLRPRPYRMDESGKLARGRDPSFKEIANGMPGLELRLPVLFDAMVSRGRLGLEVRRADRDGAARLYGLHERKGSIAVGADADLAVWDPERTVEIAQGNATTAPATHPSPAARSRAGRSRSYGGGQVIVSDGTLCAAPGSAGFCPAAAGRQRSHSGGRRRARPGAEFWRGAASLAALLGLLGLLGLLARRATFSSCFLAASIFRSSRSACAKSARAGRRFSSSM